MRQTIIFVENQTMKKTLFSLLVCITPFCVLAQLPSYLPTDGLVGWWPFNGNANDESGNGNDGTVNGPVLTTDRFGISNSAYNFISNTIDVGNNYTLNISNIGITVSAWINENNNGNLWHVLGIRNQCGDFHYQLSSNNLPYGLAWGGITPGENSLINSGLSATSGVWNNLIGTFDGNKWKLFYNSVIIDSLISPVTDIVNTSLIFGNSGTCQYFHGKIDDIGIWNRALTQEEITALYTATSTNGGGGNNNSTSANVPQGISYQAVARNPQGLPLSNIALQVKFTLLSDSLTGTTEYAELHSLTTNDLGLFTTAFGTGTPLSGTFANINWAGGNKYLKVEMDAGGGFIALGTQQMLSVPSSMRSQTSATIQNNALPVYSDNAAALAGGLQAGQMYRTATGVLMVVY
jgi:hypothetical protein